ncbi:MAG TPA: glycosyltransferase family 25 protein [Chitinophagaceae bacterium]|nr:glycosyltransferase family 25 protein [Chitinophagaceae bacterium]
MKSYWEILNNYYDHIYVISVQSAGKRRESFAERFSGLNYSFFYGADKKDFTTEQLIEKKIFSEELARKHHRYNKTMMIGEIACAWSHKMAYEDMVKKNFARVMIFEDDAVPEPSVLKKAEIILSEVPADCELLMWGWAKHGDSRLDSSLKKIAYHIQHSMGLLKWDHQVISHMYASPYSNHLKKAGFHDFAHAYSITRSGAEKLMQMQTPIQYIADNLLAYAIVRNIVNGYIVYPPAILHDNLPDGTARDSYIR